MGKHQKQSRLMPEGWHTVTPRIVTHRAKELVEFVKTVFDGSGEYRSDRPAVVKIGDSVIMISDAGIRSAAPSFLYVYVADADAIYKRALEAGAKSLERPTETPYG